MPEIATRPAAVRAIGTAVPETSCESPAFARLVAELTEADADQAARIESWAKRTTVERRSAAGLSNGAAPPLLRSRAETSPGGPTTAERMRCYAEHAGGLAAEATRNALGRADVAPSAITHLVTVSCTGFDAPGVDIDLIERVGLAADVERVQIGFMGCHGAVNGLRVADAIVRAHAEAQVLLVAVELCSVHFNYGHRADRMIANALFADGAAAAVLNADSGDDELSIASSLSRIVPETRDAMQWRIGDHGFEMTLSPALPGLIARALPDAVIPWLKAEDLTPGAVHWAAHPGGPKILDAVERSLGLSPDALATSRDVLAQRGNMSSPTVLFVLEALRGQGRRDRPVVLLGFGPGLAVEGVLLRPGPQ